MNFRDATFPTAGHLLPGAGTMVTAIETCSGRSAITIGENPVEPCIVRAARFCFIQLSSFV